MNLRWNENEFEMKRQLKRNGNEIKLKNVIGNKIKVTWNCKGN